MARLCRGPVGVDYLREMLHLLMGSDGWVQNGQSATTASPHASVARRHLSPSPSTFALCGPQTAGEGIPSCGLSYPTSEPANLEAGTVIESSSPLWVIVAGLFSSSVVQMPLRTWVTCGGTGSTIIPRWCHGPGCGKVASSSQRTLDFVQRVDLEIRLSQS